MDFSGKLASALAHPDNDILHPRLALEEFCKLCRDWILLLEVESEWPPVHHVAKRRLKLAPAAADDLERDQHGGSCIGPPEAERNADHAEDRRGGTLPIGDVYLCIRRKRLVV